MTPTLSTFLPNSLHLQNSRERALNENGSQQYQNWKRHGEQGERIPKSGPRASLLGRNVRTLETIPNMIRSIAPSSGFDSGLFSFPQNFI